MTLEHWRTLSNRSLLKVEPWLEVTRQEVRLPNGQVVDDYYAIRLPGYVVVVALTAEGLILAERHYKHGPRAVTLGLPAGYLEPGEDPLVAAQRELREETGYASQDWQVLGEFVVDGNRGCGVANLFLARDCHPIGPVDSDDLEQTEVCLYTLEELCAVMRSRQPMELCTVAALGRVVIEEMNGGRNG